MRLWAVLVAGLWATSAHALDIEWVTVGDTGNAQDKTGYGAVAYEYQIAKFETTVGQYAEFLNDVAANDSHGLWNPSMGSALLTDNNQGGVRKDLPVFINRIGAPGAFRYQVIAGQESKPVAYMSFIDALRFVNWLHNGRGKGDTETGAYDIKNHGGLAVHEPGAKVWIATENEWYKAAYFQPQAKGGPAGGYWLYPTRSNEQPVLREAGAKEPNTANYLQNTATNTFGGVVRTYADALPVGSYPNSASYYGTYDQGGNVWEWNEAVIHETQRGIRGGCMVHSIEKLRSVVRTGASPQKKYPDTGFRLARAAPQPGVAANVQTNTPKRP